MNGTDLFLNNNVGGGGPVQKAISAPKFQFDVGHLSSGMSKFEPIKHNDIEITGGGGGLTSNTEKEETGKKKKLKTQKVSSLIFQ